MWIKTELKKIFWKIIVKIPQGEAGQQCQRQKMSKMRFQRAAPLAIKR